MAEENLVTVEPFSLECVGVDDKSRIAYILFNEPFRPQIAERFFVAIVNCRLSPRDRNISITIQQGSKLFTNITVVSVWKKYPIFLAPDCDRITRFS